MTPAARARAQASTTASSGQDATGATAATSDVHGQAVGSQAGGEGSQEGDTGAKGSAAAQAGLAAGATQSEALVEGPAGSTSVLTAALGEPLSATAPAVISPAFAAAAGPSAGGAGVDLQQMIESIHATVELAARQGASQARIALQPRDLGEIRIHLSQTSDGLLARVTADSAAAAQTLAGGRSELQQSLSSLGVSLLRLDIGSSGQPQAGEREGGFAGEAERSSKGGPSEGAEDGGVEQLGPTASADGLESGGLVDVLA
jgi:flagellar hook-length control protein FliK